MSNLKGVYNKLIVDSSTNKSKPRLSGVIHKLKVKTTSKVGLLTKDSSIRALFGIHVSRK